MRSPVTAFVALLAAACLPPAVSPPPAPLTLRTERTARDAIGMAAVTLATAGFRVVQTDSAGEAITASRTSVANGNEDFVTCPPPRTSGAAAARETTLNITFTSKPASPTGSDVVIRSAVVTSYPGFDGTPMARAATEINCASNGVMERRLADALR